MSETLQPDDRQPIATVTARVERIPDHIWVHFENAELIGRLEAMGRLASKVETCERLTVIIAAAPTPVVDEWPRMPGR